MNIHPLAVVSPQAQIGSDVRIGPFAIVEDDVVIGDGCQIAGQAVIKRGTQLGKNNTVAEGAVIGGLPQHVRCPEKTGQRGDRQRQHVPRIRRRCIGHSSRKSPRRSATETT